MEADVGRGQTQSMCVGARMTERACMRDSESKRQKQSHGESGITVTEHRDLALEPHNPDPDRECYRQRQRSLDRDSNSGGGR